MSNFKVRMAGQKSGELFLYDEIGAGLFGGIAAKDVVDAVKGLGRIDTLNVRINSEGGDVFEGVAIYNFLKNHPARTIVDIDAAALSIASIIAMAGDEVRIAENAMMMIHDPWATARGSASDFRGLAERMDMVKENMVGVYAARTGLGHAELSSMMEEETWMKASDAVRLGFAGSVTENLKIAARFDPSKFKNAPKSIGAESDQSPNLFRAKLADMQRRAKVYAPKA